MTVYFSTGKNTAWNGISEDASWPAWGRYCVVPSIHSAAAEKTLFCAAEREMKVATTASVRGNIIMGIYGGCVRWALGEGGGLLDDELRWSWCYICRNFWQRWSRFKHQRDTMRDSGSANRGVPHERTITRVMLRDARPVPNPPVEVTPSADARNTCSPAEPWHWSGTVSRDLVGIARL